MNKFRILNTFSRNFANPLIKQVDTLRDKTKVTCFYLRENTKGRRNEPLVRSNYTDSGQSEPSLALASAVIFGEEWISHSSLSPTYNRIVESSNLMIPPFYSQSRTTV